MSVRALQTRGARLICAGIGIGVRETRTHHARGGLELVLDGISVHDGDPVLLEVDKEEGGGLSADGLEGLRNEILLLGSHLGSG